MLCLDGLLEEHEVPQADKDGLPEEHEVPQAEKIHSHAEEHEVPQAQNRGARGSSKASFAPRALAKAAPALARSL